MHEKSWYTLSVPKGSGRWGVTLLLSRLKMRGCGADIAGCYLGVPKLRRWSSPGWAALPRRERERRRLHDCSNADSRQQMKQERANAKPKLQKCLCFEMELDAVHRNHYACIPKVLNFVGLWSHVSVGAPFRCFRMSRYGLYWCTKGVLRNAGKPQVPANASAQLCAVMSSMRTSCNYMLR